MRPAAQSLASFLFSRFILLAHDPSRPIVASRKIAYSHARSPRAGTQDRHDAHELSQMLAVCGRVPTHGTPLRNDEVRPHKRPTAFLFHLHSSQIGHQSTLVDCAHHLAGGVSLPQLCPTPFASKSVRSERSTRATKSSHARPASLLKSSREPLSLLQSDAARRAQTQQQQPESRGEANERVSGCSEQGRRLEAAA